MKMFVFEGTPEEISAVARSMLPATTSDVALSLEVQQDEARFQSSERPTKFVTVEFARRVLGRRPVLSKPLKRVLRALNDAYPGWMLLSELHSAANYTPAQFAGLMGAFGRRMAHTEGYDKDAHFFEIRWNDDEDAWEYRLPVTVGAVLNPPQRSEMKSLSLIELKNLASNPGPKRHLAFDELARRYRGDPSIWTPDPSDPPAGCRRAPNVTEAESAHLKWSLKFNDGSDPELALEQEKRLEELDRQLAQNPDSIELEYFKAIGQELRRQE